MKHVLFQDHGKLSLLNSRLEAVLNVRGKCSYFSEIKAHILSANNARKLGKLLNYGKVHHLLPVILVRTVVEKHYSSSKLERNLIVYAYFVHCFFLKMNKLHLSQPKSIVLSNEFFLSLYSNRFV